jgi:hypothetical protein
VDTHLIVANSANVLNLKDSIRVQFDKNSRGIVYLKAVNVITRPVIVENGNETFIAEYCAASFFLIRHSISLNLKTDDDYERFYATCESFAAHSMFIESPKKWF